MDRIDGYKALLQSENQAITDSTLVQEEVYGTVIEGTEPFKCMRQVVPTTTAESYSTRIVKGESGTYADEVAEAGAIPIDTQTYSKIDIPVKKYGVRPIITNELIDDSQFDIVEMELRKAGARLENRLNRVVLNQMLNGTYAVATSTMSPAGTHIAVSDIALAAKKVKKQNFMPDTLVTHPTAEGYLLQDSNLAYVAYAGTPSPLTLGTVPKLMGLTPYTCTATDSADPKWDDTTAGTDVTALIFSKADFAMIRMKHDIKIVDYDDPIHDLVGISCLMRYGAEVINEKSACCIYHK
jgi:HK97 family phage major capsid protein